jgi:hypothetical protein
LSSATKLTSNNKCWLEGKIIVVRDFVRISFAFSSQSSVLHIKYSIGKGAPYKLNIFVAGNVITINNKSITNHSKISNSISHHTLTADKALNTDSKLNHVYYFERNFSLVEVANDLNRAQNVKHRMMMPM